jgi:hypothetical protein
MANVHNQSNGSGFKALETALRREDDRNLAEAISLLKAVAEDIALTETGASNSGFDPEKHKLEGRLRKIESDLILVAEQLAVLLEGRASEEQSVQR